MKKLELHWQILIGLILGIGLGYFLNTTYEINEEALQSLEQQKVPVEITEPLATLSQQSYISEKELWNDIKELIPPEKVRPHKKVILKAAKDEPVRYISWFGELFLRALKMVIIPLIISSIISGVANIGNAENLGRLGMKTMGYYLMTSIFAIVTGLVFVNIIKPGANADIAEGHDVEELNIVHKDFSDTLLEIVPANVVESMTQGDMLPIVFFSIIFGFFITQVNTKSKLTLSDFFNSVFEVMMKITMFIIKFTPIGILGIVAGVVAENMDKLSELAGSMGLYMLTVLAALFFHGVITLPFVLRGIGKVSPLKHLRVMRSVLLTAFSTSSSGATLSFNMQAVEHRAGVSNKITSFTLPLGATINMDGTALYECIAAMFIAQVYGYDLTLLQQGMVVITALLASIGAAGIPMAGMVMVSVILSAVGLPLEGVGLILAVDRILDMFRTAINVWSDSCGAVVIAKSEGEKLNV